MIDLSDIGLTTVTHEGKAYVQSPLPVGVPECTGCVFDSGGVCTAYNKPWCSAEHHGGTAVIFVPKGA